MIIDQKEITETVFHLSLESRQIARACQPGQFLHVKVGQGIDPLLRRPFSVHRVDTVSGRIELLYRVVGQGTDLLRRMTVGESINVMGPLGHGFDLTGDFKRGVIVAGGMGGAPVFFLIDSLLALGKDVTLMWGVGDGREIIGTDYYERLGVQILISTEDGSRGHTGYVTGLLDEFLEDKKDDPSLRGFVCGPECMVIPVQQRAVHTCFEWQASLEERMACAVGVCQGCAVTILNRGFQMVCKDGPVFDLKEIVFEN